MFESQDNSFPHLKAGFWNIKTRWQPFSELLLVCWPFLQLNINAELTLLVLLLRVRFPSTLLFCLLFEQEGRPYVMLGSLNDVQSSRDYRAPYLLLYGWLALVILPEIILLSSMSLEKHFWQLAQHQASAVKIEPMLHSDFAFKMTTGKTVFFAAYSIWFNYNNYH